MSVLKRAAEKLRGRGVAPAALALGGATATYTTVTGYTLAHLLASCAASALFSLGASALLIAETGHWLGSAAERAIVDGVVSSGVDIKSLSAADLRARLSYSPEEGRALVEAISGGKKNLVDDLVKWLLSIEIERRREAVQTALNLSSAMGPGPGKLKLAMALLEIDEATAASFGEPEEIGQLLRQLANIPADNRRSLAAAKFPIRPVDAERANLWTVINGPEFPAADLVAPIGDLSRAHPTRLAEIRKFIKNGTPLPQCQRAACAPVACQSNWTNMYSCKPGYYLSEQPVCVSNTNH